MTPTDDAKKRIADLVNGAEPVLPDDLGDHGRGPTENDRRPGDPIEKRASNKSSQQAGDLLTEDSVALAFTDAHAGRFRYDGAWFEWAGTHWRRDALQSAFHEVRNFARELAAGKSDPVRREVGRYSFTRSVERFAQASPTFCTSSDQWDRDPMLLGTPGGTVELKTGRIRPADPSDCITKLTSVAPAIEPNCPGWSKFISEITNGDAAYQRFLQQWCGYCLTGITREHALLFAYGQGGRGKGTFISTLMSILKDYAVTAPIETFTETHNDRHPTELAMLRGARLVTASETEQGRAWAEAKIKNLTGGDKISARFMHGNFFEYIPSFKLTIVGNHRPSLRNVGDAERRRFNLAPFDFKPPAPDRMLLDKLAAEAPGILTWMIDGCLDWQENGLVRPEIVKASTEDYFAGQDTLGSWIDAELDHSEPHNGMRRESSSALYSAWKAFAASIGEREGSQKAFSEKMEARGFRKERKASGVHFVGVTLRPSSAPADPNTAEW